MKHKPQSLTFRMLGLLAAVFAVTGAQKAAPLIFAAQPTQEPAGSAAPGAASEPTQTAAEVLDTVREKLDSLDSLSADLNETVVMSGSRFLATGHYTQASGNRIRLEFQMFPVRSVKASDTQTDGINEDPEDTTELKPTASLIQVSDGGTLWTLWNNGGLQQLNRQDIREILEAVPQAGSEDATRMLQDLGVGGLHALLAKLQAVMEFGPVREQTIGQTRFLVLTGRWSDTSLRTFFNATDSTSQLPDTVPEFVRVYVDADALLPRRIQYLKKHPDPAQTLVRPLVTLDFRKLTLNEAIPEDTFVFHAPEGVVEENLTPQVIERIKALANPEPTEQEPADTGQ
ncbi:MAG: hypothetical protein R3C19_17515 [Planctomycetaceae bacterium]